jgi:hypothetical protein
VNAVRSELSDAAANLSNPGERRITRQDYRDWRVRLLGATALTLDVVGFLLSGNTGFQDLRRRRDSDRTPTRPYTGRETEAGAGSD